MQALNRVITTDAPVVALAADGRLSGSLAAAHLGPVFLSAGHLSGPVVTAGCSSEHDLTTTIVLDSGGGNLNGIALEPGRVFFLRSGAPYEGYSGAGYRWVTIMTPSGSPLAHRLFRGGAYPGASTGGTLVGRIEAEDLDMLRSLAARMGLWIPCPGAAAIPRALAREAVSEVVRLLEAACRRGLEPLRALRRRRAEAGLEGAVRYLREHLAEPVRVPQLAQACGSSERTLQYRFRRWFGVNPIRFLSAMRLHEARRRLRTRGGSALTVAAVARSVGMPHLGRFADRYRRMFGELPAETRRAGRKAAAGRRGRPTPSASTA